MVMLTHLNISRRRVLAVSASLAASFAVGPAFAAGDSPVVVERFTSQGCSSCPPADAFMGELIKRREVIALSFNVDYWDYLGWRDTLASPEYSRRQRQYALHRGDGKVYTPQMVINGRAHVVGSRKGAVLRALSETGRTRVAMSMREEGSEVIVEIGSKPAGMNVTDATIWIAMIVPKVSVEIARGENTGREISYFNVARKLMPAGMWHGKAARIALPKKDLFVDGATGCAALLQAGGIGPIIGAASFGEMHGL